MNYCFQHRLFLFVIFMSGTPLITTACEHNNKTWKQQLKKELRPSFALLDYKLDYYLQQFMFDQHAHDEKKQALQHSPSDNGDSDILSLGEISDSEVQEAITLSQPSINATSSDEEETKKSETSSETDGSVESDGECDLDSI